MNPQENPTKEQAATVINRYLALDGDPRRVSLDMDPKLGIEVIFSVLKNIETALEQEKKYSEVNNLLRAEGVLREYFISKIIANNNIEKQRTILPGYINHQDQNRAIDPTIFPSNSELNNKQKPNKPKI
jgi:hypothetical protein